VYRQISGNEPILLHLYKLMLLVDSSFKRMNRMVEMP